VLRLTVLEGVSMRKAAERLGVAPATVQRARRQALQALRKGLKDQSHQSDSAP
jgi:DNA-directed RNA polymerase specialized sigma24 family protein